MYRESQTQQRRAAERRMPVAKAKDPTDAFGALIPLIVLVLVALAFVLR